MQADFLGWRFYVNAYLGQQQAVSMTGSFLAGGCPSPSRLGRTKSLSAISFSHNPSIERSLPQSTRVHPRSYYGCNNNERHKTVAPDVRFGSVAVLRDGQKTNHSYLTNSDFSSMVRAGWIGTRSSGTDALKCLIKQYYETSRAVMVAHEGRS
ncbi:hypothetical protein [Pseudomonas syringae]|uniref:hypothetical protein n=1 Tax=Pseudomonas syringae TaxID=317 RepID=UPI001058FC2D|nr:hypothetical protein [Pseudomonas syringae]